MALFRPRVALFSLRVPLFNLRVPPSKLLSAPESESLALSRLLDEPFESPPRASRTLRPLSLPQQVEAMI